MEERLAVFLAEISAQFKEILKIHSLIEKKAEELKRVPNNEDLIISLAYRLHNLYCAYEDMFKIIARFFENQIEDFSKYHSTLLKRMQLDIEGIRPRLLSEESFKILDELRGFRHVFRHAYSYELEHERVLKLADKASILKKLFQKDFETFKEKIKEEMK
ncbi:MAG: hypothetical protein MW689_000697 [Thermodesulfobacteria bacterium]|nr:hypothetical protein [Thermodesulfobacteriota bacterium]MCU4138908.1 hypothetical protein [Thermodesulfobacteriota bacterium]